MTRRTRIALTALLVAALAAAAAYAARNRPLTVTTAQVARNLPVTVFGLGAVEARVISRVGFEVGAALVELHADQGDAVRAGQVLARLHDDEQKARLARAEAGLANAKAALARSAASVERARAVLARRTEANRRRKALLGRGATSIDVAEEAEMEQVVAEAEVKLALSEVDVARAALKDAEAARDMEAVLLAHHELRAPYDAIVVERLKELGAVLVPGEPLFTLVAPDTVWVRAFVDEARAGDIRVGQAARVRLRSLPRMTFPGHVARIDIESDRVSEERSVNVACDACPPDFHLGEQAEAFIDTGVIERAIMTPEAAIESFDDARGVVWTVEDGRLRKREATFGRRTLDARIELLEGVPDGAAVVAEIVPGLREGRAARIAEGAP